MKLILAELYLNEICAIGSFFVALFAFFLFSTYTPTPSCLATPCDWDGIYPCAVRCSTNAGLFPKLLHVLFACIAGMKQSVQAASFEARVIILLMQLFKRDLSERGQDWELSRGHSYHAPNLHPVVLVRDHLHPEFCTRNHLFSLITSFDWITLWLHNC